MFIKKKSQKSLRLNFFEIFFIELKQLLAEY